MMHFAQRVPVLVALAVSLTGVGCRDAGNVVQALGQPVPKSVTPVTSVALSGSNAIVTLVLDLRGDVGKIGSFTGRLRFDPAVMTYVGEIGIDDGTLRVSNPGTGEIRVAGASASGINAAVLASFRFVATDTAALRRITFAIEELHELSHADLQPIVRSAAARPLK